MFDGPARITPVIAMLFKPFDLDKASTGKADQRYINVLSEESDPDWESYVNHLIDSQPEALRKSLLFLETPASVLCEVGLHLRVDLEDFIQSVDFNDSINIADIFRLAQLLQDGHNLVGLSMQGAWHSDRAQLGAFGGWAVHMTRRCSVILSSFEARDFAKALDKAIATSADSTAGILNQWLNRFIEGISDLSLQESLRFRYALPTPPACASPPATNAWSRTLYVAAVATDNGHGPAWACIEITPDFIVRIKALHAACNLHQVAEIRAVDSPAAWAPVAAEQQPLALAMPRLVVAGDHFFFSAQVAGRIGDIETLPLSIHWLVENFTGAGEPVYRRISPATVNDSAVG
jgi:hypothetical protein